MVGLYGCNWAVQVDVDCASGNYWNSFVKRSGSFAKTQERRGAYMTWHRPANLEEALHILSSNRNASGQFTVVSGGTDVFVNWPRRRHVVSEHEWLDVHHLEELRTVSTTSGGLQIGVAVTATDICTQSLCEQVPALQQAARVVGGWQIQNRATLGGNIANASPAADLIVPLIALGAVVDVRSARGARRVLVDTLVTGPRATDLEADELIVSITIPKEVLGTAQSFVRHDQRGGTDISLVSAAVALTRPPVTTPDQDQSAPVASFDLRVCVGAANPRPVTLPMVDGEFVWVGGNARRRQGADSQEHCAEADVVGQIAKSYALAAQPITDIRASADYRRAMVEVFVKRALEQAFVGIRE